MSSDEKYPEQRPLRTPENRITATHQTGFWVNDASDGSDEGSSAASKDLVGEVLDGRYRLEQHLADGGMGSIFVASHLQLGMQVAVKLILPHVGTTSGYIRRFEREARVLSKLSHRNIVRILDFGVEQQRPYMVMELLEGDSVAGWIEGLPSLLSLGDVDQFMNQTCDGLNAANRAGIVHRDLKPDNLFVSQESDGTRLFKLLDFGVARYDDPVESGPALTHANALVGTAEYMSPEQCLSLPADPSADIYALGCVLTELLQGTPPFTGESNLAIMNKHLYLPLPALSRPAGAEPVPELVELLRQDMLAKDPKDRPPSVAALRLRWSHALAGDKNEQRFPGRKRGADSEQVRSHERISILPQEVVVGDQPTGERMQVRLIRLDGGPLELTDDQIAGLGTGQVFLEPGAPGVEGTEDADYVLVLAGENLEAARTWLVEHRSHQASRALVSVCASAEELGQLVAAGAGDVMDSPMDVPVTVRKLQRLRRRRERRLRA